MKILTRYFKSLILKFYYFFPLRIIDDLKINQGLLLTRINELKSSSLKESNFKIFSQWGEDGIIQFLVKNLRIKNKTFIEIGVEDFIESNCRFLMMKDNWKGLVVDGSIKNIDNLKKMYFFWKYDLCAVCEFITKENINQIITNSGFESEVGILSVDLDGIDYFVLDAINVIQPSILICEFNSVFGPERKISIPYDQKFNRTVAHYSNLYWGTSLPALNYVAEKKGMVLVGVNNAFNNAFFVQKNLLNQIVMKKTVNELFEYSNYRESRSPQGKLTYLSGNQRIDLIKGLPVLNVETGKMETF